jgi:hypothetical protein
MAYVETAAKPASVRNRRLHCKAAARLQYVPNSQFRLEGMAEAYLSAARGIPMREL